MRTHSSYKADTYLYLSTAFQHLVLGGGRGKKEPPNRADSRGPKGGLKQTKAKRIVVMVSKDKSERSERRVRMGDQKEVLEKDRRGLKGYRGVLGVFLGITE